MMPRFGTYRAGTGALYRLHPAVKLVFLGALLVSVYLARPWAALFMLGLCTVAALATGLRLRDMRAALKPTLIVFVFLAAGHSLVLDGSGSWPLLGPVGLRPEGLLTAALAIVRITTLVESVLLFTTTTTTTQITELVTQLVRPLERLGVSSERVGSTLALSIRFMPVAFEHLDRIALAQRARGAKLDEGGLIARLRSWTTVLAPALVSLLAYSDDLACSMRERGYGSGKRSALLESPRPSDVLAAMLGLAVLAVLVWLC